MLSIEVIGLVVLPSIAHTAPGYVGDVLAVPTGVALIGLGCPLWRAREASLPSATDPRLDPAVAA
ncbi:hypothetical protein OHA72_42750 [Dactylosporangium sp. NBC_01737]|uniref:hypothetical protein n=1 Tax=Dactylosporangium sp. NBC_01737 TaxID=2975959 RepID=UPI002E10458F|nr:hypothetical protein OHA72_42750 [Dactylosporangium sp. NBC_01737]